MSRTRWILAVLLAAAASAASDAAARADVEDDLRAELVGATPSPAA